MWAEASIDVLLAPALLCLVVTTRLAPHAGNIGPVGEYRVGVVFGVNPSFSTLKTSRNKLSVKELVFQCLFPDVPRAPRFRAVDPGVRTAATALELEVGAIAHNLGLRTAKGRPKGTEQNLAEPRGYLRGVCSLEPKWLRSSNIHIYIYICI